MQGARCGGANHGSAYRLVADTARILHDLVVRFGTYLALRLHISSFAVRRLFLATRKRTENGRVKLVEVEDCRI